MCSADTVTSFSAISRSSSGFPGWTSFTIIDEKKGLSNGFGVARFTTASFIIVSSIAGMGRVHSGIGGAFLSSPLGLRVGPNGRGQVTFLVS